jgi:hypothetical protein
MPDKKTDTHKSGLDRLAEVEKQIARKNEQSGVPLERPDPPRGGMKP